MATAERSSRAGTGEKASSFQDVSGVAGALTLERAVAIAPTTVPRGLLAGAAKAPGPRLGALRRLSVVHGITGQSLSRARLLEPADVVKRPSNELSSRIQVEVDRVRALLRWGLLQGIWSIVVATILATIAIMVDSGLATWGLVVIPVTLALVGVLGRGTLTERGERCTNAPLH